MLTPYLDLQQIVAADALVMHLMIGIIGIAAILILHEREPVMRVRSYS